jgi:hypothetical protein
MKNYVIIQGYVLGLHRIHDVDRSSDIFNPF